MDGSYCLYPSTITRLKTCTPICTSEFGRPFWEDRTQGYSEFGSQCSFRPRARTGNIMAIAFKLNPKEIESLPPGTHADGNNLYLIVKPSGSRSYALRYFWQGGPQKIGPRCDPRYPSRGGTRCGH